jgi:hypothetical protein
MKKEASRITGLQPQRTAMAWNRMALVIAVKALLVTRVGLHASRPSVLLAGAALATVAIAFLLVGWHRQRELAGPEVGAPHGAAMRLLRPGICRRVAPFDQNVSEVDGDRSGQPHDWTAVDVEDGASRASVRILVP